MNLTTVAEPASPLVFTRGAGVAEETLTRAASFEPSTWKPEAGTIEVVFSTITTGSAE